MRALWIFSALATCSAPLLAAPPAAGDPGAAAPPASTAAAAAEAAEDAEAEPLSLWQARQAFVRGAQLAKDMKWGEALAQFEQSQEQRPHPATSYNIGVCLRALGQYARAQQSFLRALSENRAAGGAAMGSRMEGDVRAFLEELGRVLAVIEVTLDPPTAAIAVDGRPLQPGDRTAGTPTLVAGILPPGPGQPPPASTFRLLLDPGAHVFVLSRRGFADAVHRESVRPGSSSVLRLSLDRLPGQLRIASNQAQSAVTIDGVDVGVAPVTVSRPAGRYRVLVRKQGFDAYDASATLRPGEEMDVAANLRQRPPSLLTRWWFWTAAAAVVTGVTLGTYYATRPEAQRPAVNGGGLGWTVRLP